MTRLGRQSSLPGPGYVEAGYVPRPPPQAPSTEAGMPRPPPRSTFVEGPSPNAERRRLQPQESTARRSSKAQQDPAAAPRPMVQGAAILGSGIDLLRRVETMEQQREAKEDEGSRILKLVKHRLAQDRAMKQAARDAGGDGWGRSGPEGYHMVRSGTQESIEDYLDAAMKSTMKSPGKVSDVSSPHEIRKKKPFFA